MGLRLWQPEKNEQCMKREQLLKEITAERKKRTTVLETAK